MKASDEPLTKLINGTTQFIVPVFQRDYSWSEEQCAQLWADVVRVGKDPNAKHFIGSVVYAPSGDTAASFTRWLLIDGQQRLTTLTLLALALRDYLRKSNWQPSSDDGPTVNRLEAYFLRNLQEMNEKSYKLVLRRQDQLVLKALLDGEPPPADTPSRITENYDFFQESVAATDPAVIYAGISRLQIVDVRLDPQHDDPQLVFESLNSTGLDLSQADLIRNYILMRLPEAEQTRLYEKYWSKIEALFRNTGRKFDFFARDYMALRSRASKQTREDQIYTEFRRFFRERQPTLSLEETLEEMLRFARYYAAFALGREVPKPNLKAPLHRLVSLAEAAATLVMQLSDCHERGTLSPEAFAEALGLVESYVFRRSICGMQTRGYWQTFAALATRIDPNNPLTSLRVALHRLRQNYRFPSNEEFERSLKERDLYSMRNCHYLLDRLENDGSKEPVDTSTYTVEHVLPQNEELRPEWRTMLGEGWQEIQKAWLHRLGNLTLTGYNSTYSDRPFEEKKTIQGGFNDSSVRLNKFVREQAAWTDAQILERGNLLAARSLSLWPMLQVADQDVAKAQQEDLRARARSRDVSAISMGPHARALFDILRSSVRDLGADVVEVPETHSISYYAADFFLEILPRKNRLVLLIDLDFNECQDTDSQTQDAKEHKFFLNAQHEAGVVYHLTLSGHLDGAMRMIRRAYELSRG